MDLRFPEDSESLRRRFRSWLRTNQDETLVGLDVRGDEFDRNLDRLRAWNVRLADAGYAAVHWPVEYGGHGAGPVEAVVVAEELAKAMAPAPVNSLGISNIAPAIMRYGTPEQLELLRPMLRGEVIWSQGFSEPEAGSDLASLRSTARQVPGGFIVNGQKTWNTLGHVADMCATLVRTDPSVVGHAGLSYLLIDLHSTGVARQRIRNMAGDWGFCNLFFEDVHVLSSALLGPLNRGWAVATTTLTHERGAVGHLHEDMRRRARDLLDLARGSVSNGHPALLNTAIRIEIGRVFADIELLRLLNLRAVSEGSRGSPPGPESSLAKLLWNRINERMAETAAELMGYEANYGEWGRRRLYARSHSIAGGTTEVQRNIIASRILRLPAVERPSPG